MYSKTILLDENHAFSHMKNAMRKKDFNFSIHTINDIFLEMAGTIKLDVEIKFYNRQITTKIYIKC